MLQTYKGMTVRDLDELEFTRFLMLLPAGQLRKSAGGAGIMTLDPDDAIEALRALGV
jgi:hypothetical protein